MASIERRTNTHRVVWRENGTKQYETFGCEADALAFKGLVESHGGWPPGWTIHVGFAVAPVIERGVPRLPEVIEQWAESLDVAEDTARDYRSAADALATRWGPVRIDQVTKEMVRDWQRDWPGSHKQLIKHRSVLNLLMEFAWREQWIDINPVRLVPAPRNREARTSVDDVCWFTPEQYEAVTDVLRPAPWRMVDATVLTGLRWQEVTALTVDNVVLDHDHPHVLVVQAWQRGRTRLKSPKSDASLRRVFLSGPAESVLRAAVEKARSGYVFTTTAGNPWRSSAWYTCHWSPAIAKAAAATALPARTGFHTLRHTYAVWSLSAGMSAEVLQRQLGHESITITNDLYGGILDPARSAAAVAAVVPVARLRMQSA